MKPSNSNINIRLPTSGALLSNEKGLSLPLGRPGISPRRIKPRRYTDSTTNASRILNQSALIAGDLGNVENSRLRQLKDVLIKTKFSSGFNAQKIVLPKFILESTSAEEGTNEITDTLTCLENDYIEFLRTQALEITNSVSDSIAKYDTNTLFEGINRKNLSVARMEIFALFEALTHCNDVLEERNGPIVLLLREIQDRIHDLCQKLIWAVEKNDAGKPLNMSKQNYIDEIDGLKTRLEDMKNVKEYYKTQLEKNNDNVNDVTEDLLRVRTELIQANKDLEDIRIINATLRRENKTLEARCNSLYMDKYGDKSYQKETYASKDLVNMWNQISFFIECLSTRTLQRFDYERFFPADPQPTFKAPEFLFPSFYNHAETDLYCKDFYDHMISSFGECKPNDVYSRLQKAFNDFMQSISQHYVNNFTALRSDHENIQEALYDKIKYNNKETVNNFDWILLLLENSNFIKPKKKAVFTEIYSSIYKISNYCLKVFKDKNGKIDVLSLVYDSFSDCPSCEFLIFLSELVKFSKILIDADILKQFMLKKFSNHLFMFYCYILPEIKEVKECQAAARSRKRVQLLDKYFGHLGYSKMEKSKRYDYEKFYLKDDSKFMFYTLALYQHCICKISDPYILSQPKDIQLLVRRELGLSGKDAVQTYEFITNIDNGNPTGEGYAIADFWMKRKHNVLHDFNPSESSIIAYMMQYGEAQTALSSKSFRRVKSQKPQRNSRPSV